MFLKNFKRIKCFRRLFIEKVSAFFTLVSNFTIQVLNIYVENSFVFAMFSFSSVICVLVKMAPPVPCRITPCPFSIGSAQCCPIMTNLCVVDSKWRTRSTMPLSVWWSDFAVSVDKHFTRLSPCFRPIFKKKSPIFRRKDNRGSCADSITASSGSRCRMSLLIVRTFKTFHISKTFFMNAVVPSFAVRPGWTSNAVMVSSQNTRRQVETRWRSTGFGRTGTSVNFESPLTPLLFADSFASRSYKLTRSFHFATNFFPSSS